MGAGASTRGLHAGGRRQNEEPFLSIYEGNMFPRVEVHQLCTFLLAEETRGPELGHGRSMGSRCLCTCRTQPDTRPTGISSKKEAGARRHGSTSRVLPQRFCHALASSSACMHSLAQFMVGAHPQTPCPERDGTLHEFLTRRTSLKCASAWWQGQGANDRR